MGVSVISDRKILDWPHGPAHRLGEGGMFMVTSGTYEKKHLFHSSERLNYLTNALLTLAREYGWRLQAWAVFSNHYHFIGESERPATLKRLVQYLHSITAKHVNLLDGTRERIVWFQYWDTELTYEKSYLARLNYVHMNAVRHGLVRRAEQYPWCSAGWFSKMATKSFFDVVMRFPSDKVKVRDEFDVVPAG